MKTYLLSIVRHVLEYATLVWQAIIDYLSDVMEQIQNRSLNIICHQAESYNRALQITKLDRMDVRREHFCIKYINQMKSPQHPTHHLLPRPFFNESIKVRLKAELTKVLSV